MSDNEELKSLRRLLEEERRARQEADRRREEEQRRREETDQRLEEEQRRREETDNRTSPTTLLTFLDGLHCHLSLSLQLQEESQSTRGDPANTTNKLRPDHIRPWNSFGTEQAAIWHTLMESSFAERRLFTSLHTLEENGRDVRRQLVGSELDLNYFLRHTVENHVSTIIERLYEDPELRARFGLRGSIRFENHGNTLSPDELLEEGIQSMDLRGRATSRRRSPRLAAQEAAASQQRPVQRAQTPSSNTSRRPRPDQFCVYNMPPSGFNTESHRVVAYVKEYKPPHKVTLGHIYGGLEEMDLEQVLEEKDVEMPKDRLRRLVAAIIVQAFDYMIRAGSPRAVVSTGEADIYLRIDDDPSTVYYYLSVPEGDVGGTTGWDASNPGPNRLHLTAVGQSLAFTLQALQIPPRSQSWRQRHQDRLPRWQVTYADILDTIPPEDTPSSEYHPSPTDGFLRMSPAQLRWRRPRISSGSCQTLDTGAAFDDSGFDPDTPSRDGNRNRPSTERYLRSTPTSDSSSAPQQRSQQRENRRQYCTLQCLRGLVSGGVLDPSCPNMRDHGDGRHVLNQSTFLHLLRQQLFKTLDSDCDAVGIHGSRGALLKVTLASHGYTVVAKSTVPEFVEHLRYEATVYRRLRPIQGIYIPLYLGSIDLKTPYIYDGIADLVHMMLLSPAGRPLSSQLTAANRAELMDKTRKSLGAIHQLGVVHRDPAPRNLCWNQEIDEVMVLDFERSVVMEARPILGVLSPNRTRKRRPCGRFSKLPCEGSEFTKDTERAMCGLQYLNSWTV